MPLADDLMEPFRPLVDVAVRTLLESGAETVTTDAKRTLAAVLTKEEVTKAGRTPISTCMIRLAASLAESFLTGTAALEFPLHWQPRRTREASGDDQDE